MAALAKGFTSRAATLDDVEAAVDLANVCSVELIGRREWEVQQFRNDWQSPNLNPETDIWLVFAPDGVLVGYAGVWNSEPYVRPFSWGNVHPAYRRQGIGTYLAQWVEERARQFIPQTPSGARMVLHQSKLTADTDGQALLRAQGYQVARYFARMLIEMYSPPPEPMLPEAVRIRTFDRERDLRAMIAADREMFQDHWGYIERPFEQECQEWAHWIDHDEDHDPSVWFLAVAEDEIVGIALCAPKVAEDPDMAYINTLGVRRSWRRQGIGLALLHHAFGEFYRRAKYKVSLDVDADNLTGATRLYERAGMHVQRQSLLYEKELRPGKELSKQDVEA